jgi:drug/metabolite transporter (DMT)-like permease
VDRRRLLGYLAVVLAAMFFWAADNNGSTILTRRTRMIPMVSLKLLLGSALLTPVLAASGTPLLPEVTGWPVLIAIAFVEGATFTILFYFALRTIGAARAGSILSTSSLWGVLIALYAFPGQALSPAQIAGGALMILATIAMYVWGGRGPAPGAADGRGETLKRAGSNGPRSR